VGEVTESLGSLVLAHPAVLGHRSSDGVVEARVEGSKLARRDRHLVLFGQFGDRLADAAVVVNDLRDRKAAMQ
jgi:hypothetical protein